VPTTPRDAGFDATKTVLAVGPSTIDEHADAPTADTRPGGQGVGADEFSGQKLFAGQIDVHVSSVWLAFAP